MKVRNTLLALAFVIALFGSTAVHPAVIKGVRFDDTILAQQTRLFLKGTALSRYLVVLKGYAGAFYLPEGVESRQALEDVPKHLVLEYFHAIKADQFDNATKTMIKKNVSPAEFKRLLPKINQFVSAYRDVEPKDRYALTYLPGYGTRLTLNGELLIVIAGEAFAKALFSIWIGPKPVDAWFRSHVLGLSK
jgi:hypothetical protein